MAEGAYRCGVEAIEARGGLVRVLQAHSGSSGGAECEEAAGDEVCDFRRSLLVNQQVSSLHARLGSHTRLLPRACTV